MGKNIPHILERWEENKDKVPNDNQDFSNKDVWKVSLDDSDIEVISTSIKPKKYISKGVKTNAKCLAPILKRSKTKLKNVVPIVKQSETELKSIIPEQHKSLLILSNHTILQDKGIYDETRISIQDLLDLSKDDEFSSINKNFNNNESLLNKKSEDTSMDVFEPNDQTNSKLELEDDMILVTPQSIDKIESKTMLKQSRNKSTITQQSKTFRILSSDTDFKDQITYGEIGTLLDLADDDKRINDDWNNDENACNKKVYDSSTNCLPPNDILNNYIDTEDYVNIVTSESRDNTLDDKSDITKFNTLSANSAFGETDISETDNVLGRMSDDSNNFSNSDGNVRRFLDSLPPKDDPSIINNAPLNIDNVGDIVLSTDDTESLNSLVRLKCTSCLDLVQHLNVEPQMECQKCCVKYQYQCKICTSGFNSLHWLYTHLIKYHSRGEAVHSLMITPQYVKKPRQIGRLVYDSIELYNCQKCGTGFKIETIKNNHEAVCLKNPKLNCPFCSLAVSFKKTLKEHMIKLHSESFEINEVDSIINQIVKDRNKKRKDEKGDDKRINDDWNNDENACNKKVYDSSTNCLPSNDILNNYTDTEDYVNIVTSESRDNTLDDKSYITKFNTLSANSAFGETDISETDNVLGRMSDDSNNFSNSDGNVRRFLDSLPPKDDPSIINNAPLDIDNVGDIVLSTDDTESLNSLVRLKCTRCLDLVQHLNVEPQMECQKCCVKYQYQCKICTSGFNSLHLLYTHLIKFHSRGEAVHSLMITPEYVEKPRQIGRLVYDSIEPYNCQKCGAGFKIETIKNNHEAVCFRNPKFNCPFCSLAMSFKKNLKEHMIKLHSESFEINEVDSIINQIVKDGNKKRKDEKVASLLQMLQVAYCRKCDRHTPVHELLDGATTCATCGENIVFTCTDAQCSRTFLTAKTLNSHVRIFHVEKRVHYRCTNCLYVTMSRMDLIKHQEGCGDLVIRPLRLFVCPNCDKSFKKERYLKIHLQRPEACARYKQCNLVCPKCNRTFRMRHWFQNHRCKPVAKQLEPSEPMQLTELLNTGLVPIQESEYPCPDCGKVFKQMRWFNTHREKYCENKRVHYRCAHCRYKGFEKKKLKVHMRCVHIHLCTGKKLQCFKCGTMWTSIYSLNRHLDNCSGDYETERINMRKQKKNNWKEMFE